MPGKRSKYKNVHRFYCPYCNFRLWRQGGPKHKLFYLEASEIQQNVKMPHKSAVILANKGPYVDNHSWIEEFFCGEHGKLWMKITKNHDEKLVATLATSKDWQQSTHTIEPDTPNPSVSEFTYRMSRQSGTKYFCNRQ